MTIEKKDKPTKLNTNRHRKRVRKNINKKKDEAVKKNQERYGNVTGGSIVIQRQKADVSRAPAYRPERLRAGGYHSTFPLLDHVDKVKTLDQQVRSAIDAQTNIDIFASLYKQVDNGQIAHASDETKESIARLRVLQEINKQKREKEEAENESLRLAKEIGADAFEDGIKQQKMKSRPQLENLSFKYQRDKQNEKDSYTLLQNITQHKSDRKRIRKQNVDLRREIYDEIKDMHPPVPGETTEERTKREELIKKDRELFNNNHEIFLSDLTKQGATLTKQNKELELLRDEMKSLSVSLKTYKDRKAEMESLKFEDPRIADEMIKILRTKGDEQAILDKLKELKEKHKKMTGDYVLEYNKYKKQLKSYADDWRAYEKKHDEIRQNLVRKLRQAENWDRLEYDERNALDIMELPQLMEVYKKVRDSFEKDKYYEEHEIWNDIGKIEYEIEHYNKADIRHKFAVKRIEEITSVLKNGTDPSQFTDDDDFMIFGDSD